MTSIRFASVGDLDGIISFIRGNWAFDHVFVKNTELLLWQHSGKAKGTLNFVLAEEGGNISGLLGFIPMRRFDPNLLSNDVGLALWKTASSAAPGTGVRLLRYLTEQESPTRVSAIGLSQMVLPIYRSLGFEVGELFHGAILNENRNVGKFLGDSVRSRPGSKSAARLTLMSESFDRQCQSKFSRLDTSRNLEKSVTYINQRFERHPWYSYSFLFFETDEGESLMLTCRIVDVAVARILKVVDVLGDVKIIEQISSPIQSVLEETNCDYADFLFAGLLCPQSEVAGFAIPSTMGPDGLPTKFEPLDRSGGPVHFVTSVLGSGMLISISDTDQDRPNEI